MCNFDIFKDECGIYLLFTQVFQCSVFVNLWISERKKSHSFWAEAPLRESID